MIRFDSREGPEDAAPAADYPPLPTPEWYRDAKLGVFVHWGLYSVPAWADVLDRSDVTAENAYARHQYAEWYANTVRIPDSPTAIRHEEVHGIGTTYEDFAEAWHPAAGSEQAITELAVRAGARYLVPTTKHHDGFCLWDSATTTFTAARRGPGRDLIAGFARAAREAGLHLGLYYSGALDWHVTDFPPITSHDELFAFRRNDAAFAAFAAAQLRELMDRFAPDILWNDLEWPDAGKLPGPNSLPQLFREHLARTPDGMVNDRWGAPVNGVLTREYEDLDTVQESVFEATRGLGLSFGHNRDESEEHALDAPALVRLLADVVSKNGNLLINVGPQADGTVPPLQRRALEGLGAWLARHGQAIYGTRPWMDPAVHRPPDRLRFTRTDEDLHVLDLDPASGTYRLPAAVDAALRGTVDTAAGSASGSADACATRADRQEDGREAPLLREADGALELVPSSAEEPVQVLTVPLR